MIRIRNRSTTSVFGLVALILLLSHTLACQHSPEQKQKDATRVIFDSDMAGDVDDVGALATLHALADRGEARILAVGASERNRWTPLCMDAINTFYKHPDLPIGVTKDPNAFLKKSKYAKQIAEKFPRSRNWKNAMDAPDAVKVYRSVLADQPDDSVVFVTVGSLANMSNLLRSNPGEHSDLTGIELVKQKVRHWVSMAGAFGESEGEPEANLIKGVEFARHAFENWPTPITFCGKEIGARIKTGPGLRNVHEENPIRHAYKLYNDISPKSSFDQATTLYAVRGLTDESSVDYWSVSDWGRVTVQDDGGNTFQPVPAGRHRYLKEKKNPEQIANEISNLMTYEP